jgi:hypothetical protein
MALAVLVFVSCTASLVEAATDGRYNLHFLRPPEEHPWQHDDSPGDTSGQNLSDVVVFPTSPTMGGILLIPIPKNITGPGRKAMSVDAFQEDEHRSQGR